MLSWWNSHDRIQCNSSHKCAMTISSKLVCKKVKTTLCRSWRRQYTREHGYLPLFPFFSEAIERLCKRTINRSCLNHHRLFSLSFTVFCNLSQNLLTPSQEKLDFSSTRCCIIHFMLFMMFPPPLRATLVLPAYIYDCVCFVPCVFLLNSSLHARDLKFSEIFLELLKTIIVK